ncbi:MAG: hypothetical protein ACFCBW_17965 [Candidatus Competibacterales bacterium]
MGPNVNNPGNQLPASNEDDLVGEAAVVGRSGGAAREQFIGSQHQKAFEAALNASKTTYDGEVHRGHPALPGHSFIADPGRFSRPGELSIDATENPNPLGNDYTGWPNQSLETDRFTGQVVDATQLPGISDGAFTEPYGEKGGNRSVLSRLTGEDPYHHTRAFSDGARQQGAEGIRVPGQFDAPDLVVFPENTASLHDQLQPVRGDDSPPLSDLADKQPVDRPEDYSTQRYAYPEGDIRPDTRIVSNEDIRQNNYDVTNKGLLPELVQNWQNPDSDLTLRQQAELASAVRHESRMDARGMMSERGPIQDENTIGFIQNRDIEKYQNPDGPDFEALLSRNQQKHNLTGDAALSSIVKSASRTDPEYNAKMGVDADSRATGTLEALARTDAEGHQRAGSIRYGAAGAGAVSTVVNLADGEVSGDDLFNITKDTALGAGTAALDDVLTPRLGGGLGGAAASGGIIDGAVSAVASTWENADAYEAGLVSAGDATADVVVDTGVGIASGMAGMAAGAAIGSVVPVAGTAVGAVIGFGVGMLGSMGTNALLEGSGAADWAREGLGNFLEDNFEQPLANAWDSISDAQDVIQQGVAGVGDTIGNAASNTFSAVAGWLGW